MTLVLQTRDALNIEAGVVATETQTAFIELTKPKYFWDFSSKHTAFVNESGVRDLVSGLKLKPRNSIRIRAKETALEFAGNNYLLTDNPSDMVTGYGSQSIAVTVKIEPAQAFRLMGIVSNHRVADITAYEANGARGIYTGSGSGNNNDITFLLNGLNSRTTDTDSADRADGAWHTFVGVYGRDFSAPESNFVALYIDGVLIQKRVLSGLTPDDSNSAKRLMVGAMLATTDLLSSAMGHFIGDINNVVIYDKAITAAQVADYHNMSIAMTV